MFAHEKKESFCRNISYVQCGPTEFTPEIEVFYMQFERSLFLVRHLSNSIYVEYFHFRGKIQLDLPVGLWLFDLPPRPKLRIMLISILCWHGSLIKAFVILSSRLNLLLSSQLLSQQFPSQNRCSATIFRIIENENPPGSYQPVANEAPLPQEIPLSYHIIPIILHRCVWSGQLGGKWGDRLFVILVSNYLPTYLLG